HEAGESGVRLALPCDSLGSEGPDSVKEVEQIRPLRHCISAGPETRPLESRIEIARVGNEPLVLGLEERQELQLRNAKKRPQQSAIAKLPDRGDSSKPIGSASGTAADQMSLDLIFALVCGQQMKISMRAAPAGEQLIARNARCLLYACPPLHPRPGKDLMPDTPGRQPLPDEAAFSAAFRPQL